MRFLLDACLSRKLAELLASDGHDVAYVVDRLYKGASDAEVFALAVAESRAIITQDLDFGRLFELAAGHTTVLLFRNSDWRPESQLARVRSLLAEYEFLPDQPVLVLIDERQARVRRATIDDAT